MRFRAYQLAHHDRPLIVVDIGYSFKRSSCGLTWTGRGDATSHRFGVTVDKVAAVLKDIYPHEPVLILEAPLSGCHNPRGNPKARGAFEQGRAWYCQPGATACLGAIQFLQALSDRLPQLDRVWVAEAFLSNKERIMSHPQDARKILDEFALSEPVVVDAGAHSLSPLIDGVPSIRVFKH